mmetsp:Transcript_35721/g.68526  ORF Transcript_35721/g.68526 Transcript_35721/m.68526 type:complete len:243 (+) Transcript_35721:825-1553(+)
MVRESPAIRGNRSSHRPIGGAVPRPADGANHCQRLLLEQRHPCDEDNQQRASGGSGPSISSARHGHPARARVGAGHRHLVRGGEDAIRFQRVPQGGAGFVHGGADCHSSRQSGRIRVHVGSGAQRLGVRQHARAGGRVRPPLAQEPLHGVLLPPRLVLHRGGPQPQLPRGLRRARRGGFRVAHVRSQQPGLSRLLGAGDEDDSRRGGGAPQTPRRHRLPRLRPDDPYPLAVEQGAAPARSYS